MAEWTDVRSPADSACLVNAGFSDSVGGRPNGGPVATSPDEPFGPVCGNREKKRVKMNEAMACRRFQYPRWESNPDLRFRKPSFYPLNYKGLHVCIILKAHFYLQAQMRVGFRAAPRASCALRRIRSETPRKDSEFREKSSARPQNLKSRPSEKTCAESE